MDAINRNSELKDKVLNPQYIIADSAGALILCEWFRSSREEKLLIKRVTNAFDQISSGHKHLIQIQIKQ